jgi:hypothetical protein
MVRACKGKGEELTTGADITWMRRNRRCTPSVSVKVGEEFYGSLAVWRRETRGEMGRKSGASYRHGGRSKRAGLMRD